ncbi:MAG TPA: hypothetical protein VNA20_17335 [Frankiaceae bacterium]|nr:hypothetical protein [Frankiaceae bacterium]
MWFWAGTALAVTAFVAFGVVAVVRMASFEEQPIYERRSPPMAAEQSHHVGRAGLPDAPLREVPCGAIRGLRVQGGADTGDLLAEALTGLCRRVAGVGTYGVELAERIERLAEQRAIVSFANFGRTGELTTTLPGPPPRVLLNDAFLRGGGQFKGFLLPELAHELWHAGQAEITAEDELTARKVELAACAMVPSSEAFRGCTDARRVVEAGDDAALRGLRAAGYR